MGPWAALVFFVFCASSSCMAEMVLVPKGSDVTLTCGVNASWSLERVSGNALRLNSSDGYEISPVDRSLHITSVTEYHQGRYNCTTSDLVKTWRLHVTAPVLQIVYYISLGVTGFAVVYVIAIVMYVRDVMTGCCMQSAEELEDQLTDYDILATVPSTRSCQTFSLKTESSLFSSHVGQREPEDVTRDNGVWIRSNSVDVLSDNPMYGKSRPRHNTYSHYLRPRSMGDLTALEISSTRKETEV